MRERIHFSINTEAHVEEKLKATQDIAQEGLRDEENVKYLSAPGIFSLK